MAMKRAGVLLIILVAALLRVYALEVVSTGAGSVSGLVADRSVAQLVVKGEIDARDLQFISTCLDGLQQLDMSEATIVALSDGCAYFGDVLDYAADELPEYCFFAKSLSKVALPAGLKVIGEGAFAGTSICEIALPDRVEIIGDYAFSMCSELTKVTLPVSVRTVGGGAFMGCVALKEADFGALKGDSRLGERVMAHCASLEKVKLSNKLTEIPSGAFAQCSALVNVNFGVNSALTTIGNEAFACTALRTIDFQSLSRLESVGEWAFAGVQLEQVTLSRGVALYGEGVFFYNKTATTVKMTEGVKEIGAYAFDGCSAMNSVTMPSTLQSVGDRAFADNVSLDMVRVRAEAVPELGEDVFAGVNQSQATLYAPETTIHLYANAEQWKEFVIVGEPLGVGDNRNGVEMKSYFDGAVLCIDASETIAEVSIFGLDGVIYTATVVNSNNARVDMRGASLALYVAVVKFDNGNIKTVKLIRQ